MAITGILFCLAYCGGLFGISLMVQHAGLDPVTAALWSGAVFTGAGAIAAVVMPRCWPLGPEGPVWLVAGLLAVFAILNYWGRLPVPAVDDISHLLERDLNGTEQVIWGTVRSTPELTRSGRSRLWLEVEQVRLRAGENYLGPPQGASGRLYVTLKPEQAEGAYPGQAVRLGGYLYTPSQPKNPNGFDFRAYLASHGAFAGFSADWLQPESESAEPGWGLWQLRQRIAQAHGQSLGASVGPLVSAMALGRKAVDLPYDLQDAFIQAGLAHTLAASGFHVSLVLGVVLGLLRRRPPLMQVAAGASALILYVGLTGAQPSVMRAALMGGGALVGLALERQVKPLGCLLVAVTFLLAWNPYWIDSIGFRLSVVATFGLMVSVQPISRRLEFLPETLAAALAVPVAAYLWTLPSQLYYFNALSTYSILMNVAVTPLVTVISLGGITTGLVAAIWPWLGGWLAWPLKFPAQLLVGLVQWQVNLPASTLATGQISLGQMLATYAVLLLGWWQPWWRQRPWLVGGVALALAFGPLGLQPSTQVTVLAADQEPVMVVQDQRRTLLVNSGGPKTAFYTINPFLRQAGINRLAWGVALPDNSPQAWHTITEQTPVAVLYGSGTVPDQAAVTSFEALKPRQRQTLGRITLENLGAENPILRFVLPQGQPWLLLPPLSLELQRHLAQVVSPLQSQVLWWPGDDLAAELLAVVRPQVAIASGPLSPQVEAQLAERGVQVFSTERDGAVIWDRTGFHSYLSGRRSNP